METDFHCRLRAIQESKNVFSGHPQPEDGTILDLQDVFQRFMFDTTLVITTRSAPQSLSIDMPQVEFAKVVEEDEILMGRRRVGIQAREMDFRICYDFNEDYNRGDITTIVETSTAAAATPSTAPPISPCMPPPPTPCTTTATIPFTTTSISAHSSPAITIVASYTTIFHQIH
ncbi:hypothetical protein DY000_02009145 [Brassica cretica]|uniref:Plastid lipid-associated protein/fibrillin conserved domain-containing protein n=1 Tax=Brassica cretica TaxID=69181 RepID=A0ABQ7BW18_BRACR|nr:hypothetical protein DY000_02009145 [Brassica cretica]